MFTTMYESIAWPVLLMTSLAVCHISAFPSGGPSYSCRSLLPGHSNGTQQDAPPYMLSVSRQTLEAGGTTRVSIESTSDFPFLGFICAASDLFDERNDTVGTMIQSPDLQQSDLVQTLACARSSPDTAVTHTSRRDKWRVEFDWRSPADAVIGQGYKLRCTVVQSFFRCWTNIQVDLTIMATDMGNPTPGNPGVDTMRPSRAPNAQPGLDPVFPTDGLSSLSRPTNANNADPASSTGNNNGVSRVDPQRQFNINMIPDNNDRRSDLNSNSNNNPRLRIPSSQRNSGGQGVGSSQTMPEFNPNNDVAITNGRLNQNRPEFAPNNDVAITNGRFNQNRPEFNPNNDVARTSGRFNQNIPEFVPNNDVARTSGRLNQNRPEFNPNNDVARTSGRLNQNRPFFPPTRPVNGESPMISRNRQPSERGQFPERMNQIAGSPSSFLNSNTDRNRNQINTMPPRLTEFERALILELMAMGVDPLSIARNWRSRTASDQFTNGNFRRNNINDIQQFDQNLISDATTSLNTFTPTNTGFQDAGLIRTDTRVFDPMSMPPTLLRRESIVGNPNSRGLFQSLNERVFNPDFRRIRRRIL